MTFTEANRQMALLLGLRDPRVVQSQIITKAAKVGREVIPHQDGYTTFANPPSSFTFWYALQAATNHNGCLKVLPGSHRTTPLRRRCRVDDHGYPQFVALDEPLYADVAGTSPSSGQSSTALQKGSDFQELQVEAGTLILMHGNLLKSRIAYNFGVVEGSLPWLPDNFLQPYDGEQEFEKLEPKL